MAPDFEYFFRMNVQGIYGHTLPGIFYFDIPVTFLLAFLFHGLAKKNLIDQLPVFLQARFQEARNFNFLSWLKGHKVMFVISAAVGTATHIIWDGFTHDRQFFVKALPQIYEGRVVPIGAVEYPLWYVLQYISTVLGGVLIAWYVLRMKPSDATLNRPRIIYWVLLAVIMSVIVYVRMQYAFMNLKYVVMVITACSAFCIGITILGLVPFKRREVEPNRT
jgi:hypothetical protein